MRISDWSSDVCSSDLADGRDDGDRYEGPVAAVGHGSPGGGLRFGHGSCLGVAVGGVGATEAVELGAASDGSSGDGKACSEAATSTRTVSALRSEEHTSELQSLMRISYAVFCLKKKNTNTDIAIDNTIEY